MHYGINSGPPYDNSVDVGNVTFYTITGLLPDTTYYIAVSVEEAGATITLNQSGQVLVNGQLAYQDGYGGHTTNESESGNN